MSTQDARLTAIETELGTIARTALTKIDSNTQNIHVIKQRLGTALTKIDSNTQSIHEAKQQLAAMDTKINSNTQATLQWH